METSINLWGVAVSAVAAMVIGTVWYGPLFGRQYMRAIGADKMSTAELEAGKKSMWKSYLGQLVASLVTFSVLSTQISYNGLSASTGMVYAFFIWLGFILPLKYSETLWGGNKTMAWLMAGNQLVTLVVAGAIIGLV
jgi:hypothetical protein